jgi:hypothetical protein
MSNSTRPNPARRIARLAFFLALAACVIPVCFMLFMIPQAIYTRAPGYNEIRLVILILGLAGALLGILALIRRTRSKVLAIFAIVLGLIAPIQHVLFCGGDALHQKFILFCPMLWGIRIP